MTTLINDFKYAVRQLGKNPGLNLVAVLCLALGIGASTSIFSALKSLVLNPFPFPDSDRVTYIWNRVDLPLSMPDYRDIRDQNNSFEKIGVFTHADYALGTESPTMVSAVRCSWGVLPVLEVQPMLGRLLEEADQQPGATPVAVISHALWVERFGADPQIVGQTMELNKRATTIVGVVPARFEFPSAWRRFGQDVWVPMRVDNNNNRGNYWLLCIGRMKPGVTLEQAEADVKAIGQRLQELYPDSNTNKPMEVKSLHWQMTRGVSMGLYTLFGSVTLILLVACANVSGMLLARGTQRQGEFGVRLALGASRWRIVRLVLFETLMLGVGAGLLGVLFSIWGTALLRQVLPAQYLSEARLMEISMDHWMLAFSAVIALVSSLLAGWVPALMAARTPVQETLQNDGRAHSGSRQRHRFLKSLVVAQIAVAMILSQLSLLAIGSYLKVNEANLELNTDQVLTAKCNLFGRSYRKRDDRVAFWEQLIDRVRGLPGVQAVAVTSKLPLEGGNNRPVLVDDQVYERGAERKLVEQSYITSDYFEAMGIRLLKGRAIRLEEPNQVVINQAMAEFYWPDADPIGGRIRSDDPSPRWEVEVVGVVENRRQWGAVQETLPEMYYPQSFNNTRMGTLVVRTSSNASTLVPSIRHELAELDSSLPLHNIRTMKDILRKDSSGRRAMTHITGIMVGITLFLTIAGVYGTLSYLLNQRRREIGIRIALGALPRNILRFIVSQVSVWLLSGLGLGLIGASLLSLLVRSQVYGISVWHPGSYLLGLGMVICASVMACLIPTLQTLKTDPMEALRSE